MNQKIPQVDWTTRILSSVLYIREISLDGKKSHIFNRCMGYYDLYVTQVMRAGNCLTLLSTSPYFSLEYFKKANLFEDLAKYVFCTFNIAFLQNLKAFLGGLSLSEWQSCYDLLKDHRAPHQHIDEQEGDRELLWCRVKNNNLKADLKFALMYEKDKNNRSAVPDVLPSLLDEAACQKKKAVTAVSDKSTLELSMGKINLLPLFCQSKAFCFFGKQRFVCKKENVLLVS